MAGGVLSYLATIPVVLTLCQSQAVHANILLVPCRPHTLRSADLVLAGHTHHPCNTPEQCADRLVAAPLRCGRHKVPRYRCRLPRSSGQACKALVSLQQGGFGRSWRVHSRIQDWTSSPEMFAHRRPDDTMPETVTPPSLPIERGEHEDHARRGIYLPQGLPS